MAKFDGLRIFGALGALLFMNTSAASSFECLIEPSQTAALLGTATGIIDSVQVRRGDKVRKGQVLVTLESSAERASLNLAAYKASMTGPEKAAQTKMEYAKRLFIRRNDMHAQNLMSTQEKDDAESEMKSAEAELVLAQENHAVAQLELEQQKALFERRTIRSPFDGVVVDQLLYAGEVADPSNPNRPILKLAGLNPLRVHVILPRSVFGQVKIGMKGQIKPEAPIGGQISGTVKIMDSVIDGASGTFAAFLEVANSMHNIPTGIRCQVDLPIPSTANP
jgi:RND family efflux transporter MFP subunit